jgi:glutaredoxin 2
MKGSAKFYEDVKIKSEYKFKDKRKNINKIIDKINDCLEGYENHIEDFKDYQEFILNEKEIFEKNVKNIFKEIINE